MNAQQVNLKTVAFAQPTTRPTSLLLEDKPMNNAPASGHRYEASARSRGLLGALASIVFCISMSTAVAKPIGSGDADSPDGSPEIDNYRYDPTYGLAGVTFDRFSDSSTKNYFGQKIARLDNGDVIVAGIVPRSGSSVADQVGLVKYSPSGRRQTWSSIPSPYSRFDQYIVYPNANSGQPTGAFIGVVGLEVHENNILVMANEQSTTGAIRPIMMVFSSNGIFRGWWFNTPGGNTNKPGRGFTISGSKLIVLGDDPVPSDIPSRPRIWMSRYTIDPNGGLGVDSTFGSGGFAFYRASACTTAATAVECSTYAAFEGIKAQKGPVVFASPKYYVAVTFKGSGVPSYDASVLRFNGNGSRDLTFGVSSTGYDPHIAFDDGGDNADYAVSLQTDFHVVPPLAYVDDIYLTLSISRNAQRGIGVVRLDGNGDVVSSFGNNGRILFGGCGSGTGNCTFSNVEEVPWSMAKDGNHLAIGGWYRGFSDPTSVIFNYPMLAVVNANTGAIENLKGYNNVVGSATIYGIVANGDGSFTGAGDVRDNAASATLSFFSARLQSRDVIFHNGVE